MRTVLLVLLLVFSSSMFGCGSTDSGMALMQKANKSNIQRLANLYRLYQATNDWRGPESVEDMKEFIKGLSANRLSMYGVDADDIESLFVSERDGEESKFRFRVKDAPMFQSPVVFEQIGKGVYRLVGFTSLPPKEVSDDSEYDDLLAGKFVSEKPPVQGR